MIVKKLGLQLLLALVVVVIFGASEAQAQSRRYYALVSREQALDEQIRNVMWNYAQRTGKGIPVTRRNVRVMINIVGAAPEESHFVSRTMQFYSEVIPQVIHDPDHCPRLHAL